MSLFHEIGGAFAAGVGLCCVAYAATALPAATSASIDNFTFKPDTITVPIGTTVVWENDDDMLHWMARFVRRRSMMEVVPTSTLPVDPDASAPMPA
jgi:plastocyanin